MFLYTLIRYLSIFFKTSRRNNCKYKFTFKIIKFTKAPDTIYKQKVDQFTPVL